MNFQHGFQEAGDGEERRADILVGGNFGDDDRGNAVFNVAWTRREKPRTSRRATSTCTAISTRAPRATTRASAFPALDASTLNAVTGNCRRARRSTRRFRSYRRELYPELAVLRQSRRSSVFLQNNAVVERLHRVHGVSVQAAHAAQQHAARDRYAPLSLVAADALLGLRPRDLRHHRQHFVVRAGHVRELQDLGQRATDARHDARGAAAIGRSSRPGSGVARFARTPNAPYRLTEVAKYFDEPHDGERHAAVRLHARASKARSANRDWTWEAFTQYGDTTVLTNFVGFLWDDRRVAFAQATDPATGLATYGKGLRPGRNGQQHAACTARAASRSSSRTTVNGAGEIVYHDPDLPAHARLHRRHGRQQTQRNVVKQRIFETNFQGKIADMRAGELRGRVRRVATLERKRRSSRIRCTRRRSLPAARRRSTRSTARSCCRCSASSSSRSECDARTSRRRIEPTTANT